MIETIYLGLTGLSSFSKGLKVIANNTTNLNTPGYKSSSLRFTDTFYAMQGQTGSQGSALGHGVGTAGTNLSFKPGEMRQTGNQLDLAINGDGLFILRHDDGHQTYTRAGQFAFNDEGVLIHSASGAVVLGIDDQGNSSEISIANRRTSATQPTGNVTFAGNLTTSPTTQTLNEVKVVDRAGTEHSLDVRLTTVGAAGSNTWTVELMDGSTVIGSQQLIFQNGTPTTATSKLTFNYTVSGLNAQQVTLDFSQDVTSFTGSSLPALAFSTQDGFAPASLTSTSFDSSGALKLTYANGQEVLGPKLRLARFDSPAAVGSVGDTQFEALDPSSWHYGVAGDSFGTVRAGFVEISNVDLSQEFSELVIMQRGYQASSQVISTANEMLQELFQMKGR